MTENLKQAEIGNDRRGRGRPAGGGKTPGSGRKKGTPNRITKDVKAAVLEAFHRVGGAEYLAKMAEQEPRVFGTLLAKCIPSEVTGKDGKDLIPQDSRPVLVVPAQATPEAWAEAVKNIGGGGSGQR